MTRRRDVRDRVAVNRWRRRAARQWSLTAYGRSLRHGKPKPNRLECRDRSGRVITSARWARLIEDERYRRVRLVYIGDVMISTVWLGVEHPIDGWFETLIQGGGFPETCMRAPNEKLARIQHRRVARVVRIWADVSKREAKERGGTLTAASVSDAPGGGREGALYYRALPDDRELVVYPIYMGRARLCLSDVGSPFVDDAYCYPTPAAAIEAAMVWDGYGDAPVGWHRHPRTGRRRENGDPTKETVRE